MSKQTAGITLVLTLLLSATGGGQNIAGAWSVSVEPAFRRTEDGGSQSRRAFKGTLTVTLRGTEAAVIWSPQAGVRRDWDLRGSWKSGQLELASDWREIEISNNGNVEKTKARWLFRGQFVKDTLQGTCAIAFEKDEHEPLFQKWTATRSA